MKTTILCAIFLIVSSKSYAWLDVTIDIYVKKGNICVVNREDTVSIHQLKNTLKVLLDLSRTEYPKPLTRIRYVEYLGETETLLTFVSLATSPEVEYGFYVQVQNEIERAYSELRNEFAIEKFKMPYKKLTQKKRESVDKVYKKIISEAEPDWWYNQRGYYYEYMEGYVKK